MDLTEDERRTALEAIAEQVRTCTRCPLHAHRTNAVPGEGPTRASLFFIGEAPGRDEDASGRPFVGRAGRILDAALRSAGLPRESVFITNVVKCRPPGNRRPKSEETAACRPYLVEQMRLVEPHTTVTLGATALRGLMGRGPELKEVHGKSLRLGVTKVIATYHPAGVLYNRRLESNLRHDVRKAAAKIARALPRERRSGPSGKTTSRGRRATHSRRPGV